MTEPDRPDRKLMDELAAYMTRDRAQELIAAELTPRKGRGSAWMKALGEAARAMGDGWTVVGTGIHAKLLHTPVAWWISAVGNDASPTAWLTLTHQPLTTPLNPDVYTIRQDRFSSRQLEEFPLKSQGRVDIFDTAAMAALVQWFAQGPLTEYMTRNSDRAMAGFAERWYVEKFDARPRKWPMLAGWRVVFDTGSPLPVIDDMLKLIDRGFYEDEKPFWEAFRALARTGNRSAMLSFLDTERRRGLHEDYNLADSQISNVLADS